MATLRPRPCPDFVDSDTPTSLSAIIGVDPDSPTFTCVGYGISTREPCRNPINLQDRIYSLRLLNFGTIQFDSGGDILHVLGVLARSALCRVHKRKQGPIMVAKWYLDVSELNDRLEGRSTPSISAVDALLMARREFPFDTMGARRPAHEARFSPMTRPTQVCPQERAGAMVRAIPQTVTEARTQATGSIQATTQGARSTQASTQATAQATRSTQARTQAMAQAMTQATSRATALATCPTPETRSTQARTQATALATRSTQARAEAMTQALTQAMVQATINATAQDTILTLETRLAQARTQRARAITLARLEALSQTPTRSMMTAEYGHIPRPEPSEPIFGWLDSASDRQRPSTPSFGEPLTPTQSVGGSQAYLPRATSPASTSSTPDTEVTRPDSTNPLLLEAPIHETEEPGHEAEEPSRETEEPTRETEEQPETHPSTAIRLFKRRNRSGLSRRQLVNRYEISSYQERVWPTEEDAESEADNFSWVWKHVTRRPVEGDCNICFDPLFEKVEKGKGAKELVWCDAECGTNFHLECMGEWMSNCSWQPTCPNW